MSFPVAVRTLYFQCDGCKTQWSLYVDPPITSAQELDAYLKSDKMIPCPKSCGSATCSIALRIGNDPKADPNTPKVDPFSLFEKMKDSK